MAMQHTTPFLADSQDVRDVDGAFARIFLMKATFAVQPGASPVPAETQRPIMHGPEYMAEPGHSSLRYETDWAYRKLATDIAVAGHVHSPDQRPVTELLASLTIGDAWQRQILVSGDRRIRHAGPVMAYDAPEPFTAIPICWERSFGGTTATGRQDRRNPIGAGLVDRRDLDSGTARSMPNFEDPARRMAAPNFGVPYGLGFIDRGWEPRVGYAGTYDEQWRRDRMPILPTDFDERFFNAAAPGMVYPGFLQGGEQIAARNLTPTGSISFALPKLSVTFRGSTRDGKFALPGAADTLTLELDQGLFSMVWRAKTRIASNESETDTEVVVVSSEEVW